jgi:hypothetical protein
MRKGGQNNSESRAAKMARRNVDGGRSRNDLFSLLSFIHLVFTIDALPSLSLIQIGF